MNPFLRGSKNPFSSMKQVILEAQAVAAASAKLADASSISLQTSREDESQDSAPSLSPSSLPPSPSSRLNLSSNKGKQSNAKVEPTPKLAPNVSAVSLQQDLYFPSSQVDSGNSIDEHGLAGFFFRITLLSCSSLRGKNENGTSDPIVQLEYDGRVVFSTVCKSTNNPTWNECFNFNVSARKTKLTMTVWNNPKLSIGPDAAGSFLGTAVVQDVSSSLGVVQNILLQKKGSQNLSGGSICFRIDDPALKKPDVHPSKLRVPNRAVQVAPTWVQVDPPQDESWLEIFYDILAISKQKGWYISPTITFKSHKACSYYSNDSDGCVIKTDLSKKRSQHAVDFFSIFCPQSDSKYSNIAAMYVYNVSKNDGTVKPCIAYFTVDETREFLSELSGREHNGIFVAFEDPPATSGKNTVIRALWTPHMVHQECRQNVNQIDAHQQRILPEDRACTFDGRQHQSNRMAASKSITVCIERKCNALAEFFKQYMTTRNHLDAMTLYFKIGQAGRQQCKFLWCASARFTKSAVHAKNVTAIEDIRILNPLEFANSRNTVSFQSYRPSTCEKILHRGTGALILEKNDDDRAKQLQEKSDVGNSGVGAVPIDDNDDEDEIEIVSMEELLRDRQVALLLALKNDQKDEQETKTEIVVPLWEGVPQIKEIFDNIFELEVLDPYAPRRSKKVISVQSWLKYCAEKQVSSKLHCLKSQLKNAFVVQKKQQQSPGSPKRSGLDLNFFEFCKLCIYLSKTFRQVVESKCQEKIDWSAVHSNADPRRCNSSTIVVVNVLLNIALFGSIASLSSSAPIDAKLTKRIQERKSKIDVCPLCKTSLRCTGFGDPWAQTFDTPASEIFVFFAMYGFENGYTMLARRKDVYMSKDGTAKRLRILIDLISQSSPLRFGKSLNPLMLEDGHPLKLTYLAFVNFVAELLKSAGSLLVITPESLINCAKDSELLNQIISVCESCSLAMTSCKFEILKVSMSTPESVATVPHPSLIFGAHSRRVPQTMKPQASKTKLVAPMPTALPALMQASTPSIAFRTSTSPSNGLRFKKESRDIACGRSPMHSSHGLPSLESEKDVFKVAE
jgi:hypothetical protein